MPNDDVCLISVATFDRLADRYAGKYFELDIYDRYLAQFARRIAPRGAKVLDVACGPGNGAARLAKLRPDLRLVGIDLAPAMVQQARRRVPSAQFLVQDCRQLDTLGQVFDAAAFAFGLSYLTANDAKRFFASLNITLSDSAVLYLATITGEPGWSGFETARDDDRVYQVYRSVDDVVSMVERAGYNVDLMDIIPSPANAPKPTQDLVLIAQRNKSVAAQPQAGA